MPGSTVSLESLSSPSPSPPPPQEEQHSNHSGPAGLGSDSELSELTEEEQDNDNRANEDDASRSATRKKKQRGHIVPEPMWDWALKKKKTEKKEKDWRNKFEEEEEEEQAGPAKAMEEEEEDDQDKGMDSDREPTPDKDGALSDNEVADDDDDPPEDEGESGDEAPSRIHRKAASEDISIEENDGLEDEYVEGPDVQQSPKAVASPDLTDDENEVIGEDEIDEEDLQDAEPTTKEGSEVDEDEDDAVPDDVDAPDADEQPTTEAVTPANGIDDALDADATMDVDDAVAPVLRSPVAAASIMAGASLIRPPSPSSSQPSTPSVSRASSRFPSAEPEQEQDVPSEPEAEPEPERKAASGRGGRARKGKGRTRAPRRSRAAVAADPGEAEADADQAELPEGEPIDPDDDVATPDLDLDSDMQPAHRAEALDVLAAIELKFALLRERLYVEKMDSLAWEESLIVAGTHPELLHLHAELSHRRDKRLELATRRRDYEVENVRKRRRLDEAGTWSTWQHERDELQKTMIAETNGQKRRLERERKLTERPPPARHFPMPLRDVPPAPTLREIVKSSPFGLPESAAPLGKRVRKKEQQTQGPLTYPTLSTLSRAEILQDLDLFINHRQMAAGYDPHRHIPGLMNAVLGGGMPPHGMDPYAMGMQIIDGGARFAPPIQQPHLQQPGMVQAFGPPRLPHHHSAPPGGLPHLTHAQQLQMEQEMHAAMRQPPGMPQHPAQFGPGPAPGMRRSISPVPLNGAGPSSSIPTTIGGGPVPPGFSGSKPNGWSGPPAGGKESKRMNGDADPRDRERMTEVMAQRERADRERAQRDLDREREREAERAYHMSHTQPRHGTHQHPHQHVHSNAQGQAAHHHASHNHQHHHHHVHHHHHPPPQGFNGPGSSAHPPPMTGLPSGSNANAGTPGQSLSPHHVRDFEQRRARSGAPTEVIELSASTPKQQVGSPHMSAFWQGPGNDEPPPPLPSDHQRDRDRDRGRPAGPLGTPQAGQNDRIMTPFTMGPSQTIQRSLPGSPRNSLANSAPSNPPPSMPTSRRGSWSAAAEDLGYPRPSSGPGIAPSPSSSAQRPATTRLPPPPSVSSFHSPYASPPHSNGRALPPASPSAASHLGPLRSPVRAGRVPPGGPPSPPPSLPLSPHTLGSPGVRLPRVSSPGLSKAPKMGGFPIPESGNIAPIATASGGPLASVPGQPTTLLPPPPGVPLRMPNGSLSEKTAPQLSGVPLSTKVVPVDGS
ncbi:hypothetical protein C8Q76DRAFT_804470 [Earliella scabrosa]|nr:hypothetical protein C8Q76DRAFT_804470 [Earliella scabrosa]